MSAILSFLGGNAFRLIFGEIAALSFALTDWPRELFGTPAPPLAALVAGMPALMLP